MVKQLLSAYLVVVCTITAIAQPEPTPVIATMATNQVKVKFQSNGYLFHDYEAGKFIAPYAPGAPEKSLIQGSGLWMAGLDPGGNLHGAIQLYNEDGRADFYPPIEVDSLGNISASPENQIWSVTEADILAHQEDWADNQQIDNPNPAIFGWPGRGNPFFSDYHDFSSNWTEQSAGFWDQNGDILYNPDQGDYPILELQGCQDVGIPSEMHWSYFGDEGVHTQSGLEPMSVQIRQTVFSFACSDHDLLNRTVFVLYRIEYQGVESLDSVHLGVFTDFSIGCPDDDYLGFIPSTRTAYAYNAENTDEDCGEILGYGGMPPAVATTIIRAPLEYSDPGGPQPIFPSSMVSLSYDPDHPSYPMDGADYYALLSGSYRDGTPIENGGYTLNGNPNNPNEWSELQTGATPGNRRSLMAIGPMQLNPGEINQLLVAYTFFQGGNHLENVQSIYDEVGELLVLTENCFNPACTMTVGVENRPAEKEAVHLYPNPTDANLIIEFGSSGERALRLYNTLGQGVWEGVSQNDQYTLRTQDLPSGAYYLQIQNELQESQVQRILISH